MPQGMGAGFVSGLSEHLDAARERKLAADARKQGHAREAIKLALDSGQVQDISELGGLLEQAWPDIYGETAKKNKKGGIGAHDIAGQFLQHAWNTDRQNAAATPTLGAPTATQAEASGPANPQVLPPMGGGVQPTPAPAETTGQGGPPSDQSANEQFGLPSGQETLPSKAVVLPAQHPLAAREPASPIAAAAQAPAVAPSAPQPGVATGTVPIPSGPRRTFMGIPVLSPEEADQRAISRSVNKTGQTLQAQMDLARRMYPAMKALDPSITLTQVLTEITGHRVGGVGGSASPYATVRGTVDGKPVGALLDKVRGGYVDPITHEPIENFIPGSAGTSSNRLTGAAGQAVNAELMEMGIAPQTVEPTDPRYMEAVRRASVRLNASRDVTDATKALRADMLRWQAGEPMLGSQSAAAAAPAAVAPGTAPAASTAAAGAGVPPGAAPTAQEPTSPAVAPSGAAPAPTPRKYHGAVYDTLPPIMQDEAERMAFFDEQAAVPRGGNVTPRQAKLMSAAKEINPDWSQSQFPVIVAAKKGFTTGKQGEELKAYNTALGHLQTFANAAEQLDNSDIKLWNQVGNLVSAQVNNPRLRAVEISRHALAGELTKVFRGAAGAEQDVQDWAKVMTAASTPEEFASALRTLDKLLLSRRAALKTQWGTVQGVPAWDKMGFESPESKDAVAKTDVIARRMASGQAPPKATKPAAEAAKPAGPRAALGGEGAWRRARPATAGQGAEAPVPGAVMRNGKLYIDNQPVE